MRHVDLACGVRLDVLHFVTGNYRGRRICAVSGIRNQHDLARVAMFLVISANQQQARQFALRAGRRLQRDDVHPGNFQQAFFQQLQHFQAALRKLLRLVRMLRRNARQARNIFVDARIVFHRTRAQRIHAQINRVVPVWKVW